MDYCVFVRTNHQQMPGALASQYAMKRNSAHAEDNHVRHDAFEAIDRTPPLAA